MPTPFDFQVADLADQIDAFRALHPILKAKAEEIRPEDEKPNCGFVILTR
jgi:hypothetical protein